MFLFMRRFRLSLTVVIPDGGGESSIVEHNHTSVFISRDLVKVAGGIPYTVSNDVDLCEGIRYYTATTSWV